ncbi:hypothetical protein E4U42_006762 [Claviceps africana]|uniref:Uncharacterized protein n=1 Tax=Claviceps africana TaxID=83212 RepID=A0A8K0J2L2_9HYPO|nr:hypothetical protein E4U42_006762 [Claviceps africana]
MIQSARTYFPVGEMETGSRNWDQTRGASIVDNLRQSIASDTNKAAPRSVVTQITARKSNVPSQHFDFRDLTRVHNVHVPSHLIHDRSYRESTSVFVSVHLDNSNNSSGGIIVIMTMDFCRGFAQVHVSFSQPLMRQAPSAPAVALVTVPFSGARYPALAREYY